MAEQKIVDGDYIITCDNGAGRLNIIANVDITGTLTYSNVVTVNAAFFTVAESNPGTILDMGMLAQTGPTTFAGLRYDVPNACWQVSNSVNSAGAAITPYSNILTTGSTLVNPNIGVATGISLTLDSFIQANSAAITGNAVIGGWANVGNLSSVNLIQGNTATINVINSGNINSNATISTTGQVRGSDVIAAGVLSGTILNATQASVTGNITAGHYIGDGGFLSNLNLSNANGAYNDANVAAFLASGNSTPISVTGNISGDYFFGNVSQCVGFPTLDNYSNANVAAFLPTYTGILTANTVSTTANITAQNFIGNGALLTGLPASYSNANATALLANFGSNAISTTGTINAGDVYADLWGDLWADYIYSNGAQNVTFMANIVPNGNLAFSVGNSTTQWSNIWANAVRGNNAFLATATVTTVLSDTVTANIITGDGGNISNIQWNNISGANSFVANYLPTDATITLINSNVANTNSNVANTNSNVSALSNTVANLSGSAYSNANVDNYLPVYGGNILADYVIANSVVLANATRMTRLSAPVTASAITNISLPAITFAVNYDWVLKSTDNSSVSMGKGFVTANSTSVSTTYYGNSSVGTGLGDVTVSGNASTLIFSASAGSTDGIFILLITEFIT